MRHLLACPSCRLQYDVTGHATGERVRCRCDEIFVVTPPRCHEARPVRCGSCGAPFAAGSRRCDYCRSETTLEDRNLSSVCPECYVRIPANGRHCTGCGVAIAPQLIRPAPIDRACPRCSGRFQVRAVLDASVTECGSCGGLWIEPELFDALCREAAARGTRSLAERGAVPRPDRHPFRYLPCVVCADMMVPRNHGGISGVVIDVCGEHGVWLDHRELERILAWVREGGPERARERAAARRTPAPAFRESAAATLIGLDEADAGPFSLGAVLDRIVSWLAEG